ncbi:hypothetical protein UC8_56450 [Roseimaritima ulvae]|uniref:Uncharacterized protein n=1 Tax=Roseimaritima ulvae TaxID=980254 RepID=A0A5B9QX14_9BACT|nr:hypothetical protein UC8_56450 [Roseimaritima ulvae]
MLLDEMSYLRGCRLLRQHLILETGLILTLDKALVTAELNLLYPFG